MTDGPVFLRLTEPGMQQLRRMTVCAAQSLLKLQAHSQHRTLAEQQNSLPSSSSAHTSATAQDPCAQQTVRSGALTSTRDNACMLLRNRSPVDLCFGQLGTDEQIMLASDSELGYNWHSAPGLNPIAKKLLHVTSRAAIASSGAQPGKQGNSRVSNRAVIQQEGLKPAHDRADVQWSEAFEGMAESTAVVSIPVQNGLQALLSVQTRQVTFCFSPYSKLLQVQHVRVFMTCGKEIATVKTGIWMQLASWHAHRWAAAGRSYCSQAMYLSIRQLYPYSFAFSTVHSCLLPWSMTPSSWNPNW